MLAWLFSLAAVSGASFDYFSGEIDYWNAEKKKEVPKQDAVPQKAATEAKPKEFNWEKHLDPKNPEFFKEGDYTPPEPFMEIVRNPSDENLKLWFKYLDRKSELSSRLQNRMSEYLAKEGKTLEPKVQASLRTQAASLPRVTPDAKRYRFRMYFDSTCPHCRQMFGTLKTLQDQGFFVEAKQLDSNVEALSDLPIVTSPASKEEVAKYKIESVPFLLIGDLKQEVVYQMTGFQSPESIFEHLQSQRQKERIFTYGK